MSTARAFDQIGKAKSRAGRRLALFFMFSLTAGWAQAQPATRIVQVGPGGLTFRDTVSGTSTTTITAGDTVQWAWLTSGHSTTSGSSCSPDGRWDSGVQNTLFTFSVTFTTPGTFPYFCRPHCFFGMTGTIVVQPATPTPTFTPTAPGAATATPAPTATPGPGLVIPAASPWTLAVLAIAFAGIGFFLLRRDT